MRRVLRSCISILLVLLLFLQTGVIFARAESERPSSKELQNIAIAILDRKKAEQGATSADSFFNAVFLQNAGSTAGDWYPFAIGRLGVDVMAEEYLAVLYDNIEKAYRKDGTFNATKATEYHRMILAILAMGGDPTHVGIDRSIDLLRDGVWNRVDKNGTPSLGKQGVNGYIWGLLAIDSMQYEVPDGATYTRETILSEVLSAELPTGGWALSGSVADVDVTAMAIQALAPYRDVRADVKDAIDRALNRLSELQDADGGFSAWGRSNAGSVSQVLIALCTLGIDPFTDARFVKNGNTAYDAIMRFQLQDGGFSDSVGGSYNSRASEQTLCAVTALWRMQNGMRCLYDLRPDDLGETPKVAFSAFDAKSMAETRALPTELTLEHRPTVLRLLYQLSATSDVSGREEAERILLSAKAQIDAIILELERLESEIAAVLYPFDALNLRDYGEVQALYQRYEALSVSNRAFLSDSAAEDLLRAKAQLQTELRATLIGAGCGLVVLCLLLYIVFHIRHRRRAQQLPESDE